MSVVIIVGAGSSLSDAMGKPLKRRPPLDHGFFSECEKLGYSEFNRIKRYLINNYDIDPSLREFDSLERIMAIIYTDINNPQLEQDAVNNFRELIKLFNRRIAESTNELNVTYFNNLYRIIGKKLTEGISPSNISIITFNQDIQIEKALERLQETEKYNKYGNIFSFPGCYQLRNSIEKLSQPPDTVEIFTKTDLPFDGIRLFKLHGSLNWFSAHTSKNVPKNAILSANKEFMITPRRKLNLNMTFTKGKKKTYTFPLIIPPVNHKAALIHNELHPLWKSAETMLSEARKIIVFGYSCPPTDFESANMIRRATNTGSNPVSFDVIDPNHNAFSRYVDVTGLDHLSYYRSCDAYIKKG